MNLLNRDPLETQRQLLIPGCPKQVAAQVRYSVDSIWRLKRGQYPVSAFLAFDLARAQQDFRFLTLLAENAGALLTLPRPRPLLRPTILLLADLALNFGRFFELAEKVQREEPLSDEEMRELEESGEQIKHAVDGLIERGRQQRRERSRKEAANEG